MHRFGAFTVPQCRTRFHEHPPLSVPFIPLFNLRYLRDKVYGQMDLCRKQAKSLKALAGGNSREARLAWTKRIRRERQEKQQQQQLLRDGDRILNTNPHADGVGSDEAALLRRYSELNLQTMPVP